MRSGSEASQIPPEIRRKVRDLAGDIRASASPGDAVAGAAAAFELAHAVIEAYADANLASLLEATELAESLLSASLDACSSAIVWLRDNPTPEGLALAEQLRAMLAQAAEPGTTIIERVKV